jgi:hypothetical protein
MIKLSTLLPFMIDMMSALQVKDKERNWRVLEWIPVHKRRWYQQSDRVIWQGRFHSVQGQPFWWVHQCYVAVERPTWPVTALALAGSFTQDSTQFFRKNVHETHTSKTKNTQRLLSIICGREN